MDVALPQTDTPQFEFRGGNDEIRIFSVKICINPYPSFMHRCIAKNVHAIHMSDSMSSQSLKNLTIFNFAQISCAYSHP